MPSLRITGGELRGRRIPLPAHDLRPTSERARQAYFNIVSNRIEGAQFLDLFAGSGIFSFEALSRGAAGATAIELSRRAAGEIEQRAAALDLPIEVIAADVLPGLKRLDGTRQFSLIYADPPYDYTNYDTLLESLDLHPAVPAEALLALEHRSRRLLFGVARLSRLSPRRTNTYGEVSITFFETV